MQGGFMNEEESKKFDGVVVDFGDDETGTEIRETDIVFDCPHCGHNLAIDYRGAGLQIECVNCGESVLVPIPDGMKIDDLDIEPGEILKQLFATRRNLQRVEKKMEALEESLRQMTAERDALQSATELAKTRLLELRAMCRQQAEGQERTATMADRIVADFGVDIQADGESAPVI
jgi:hypothetical protein